MVENNPFVWKRQQSEYFEIFKTLPQVTNLLTVPLLKIRLLSMNSNSYATYNILSDELSTISLRSCHLMTPSTHSKCCCFVLIRFVLGSHKSILKIMKFIKVLQKLC
uniref:(northern house mosquito) hypothetical protein n=1 Tax=Culex pipiens TaxID=7175 RepID=A0A8D8A659_CULPI